MPRILAIALAYALLAPAAALGLPKPPPVKDGVSCHLDLKKTYRVAKVARSGLPLDVTCTGGRHARTRVMVTLAVERGDGYPWSEPKLNRRITLVR